jgi:hypothetical protein
VENQEFDHWQPLKSMDLERCENSPREGKDLSKNNFQYMAYVRSQDVAVYARKELLIACCYEH